MNTPTTPDKTPTVSGSQSITSLELANLAAAINPTACQNGSFREALFDAMALFVESCTLCREMSAYQDPEARCDWLVRIGSKGSYHLFSAIAEPILNAPVPVLTLAATDKQEDTLRPYLQEKDQRSGWKTVRMVKDNLRKWFSSWKEGGKDYENSMKEWEQKDNSGKITHFTIPQRYIDEMIAWKKKRKQEPAKKKNLQKRK